AARVLTESAVAPEARPARSLANAAEDETAARRYARLLLSEIKLYHEADVAAGQRERDLTARLGGEIARARTLYEQRMPQPVHAGYFHDELIRTLGNGDESLFEAPKSRG